MATQGDSVVKDLSETRLELDHMATNMYQERVVVDTRAGQLALHKRNPDARQLYFKGAHDMIVCISTWMEENVAPELFAELMEKMHEQTSGIEATGTAH